MNAGRGYGDKRAEVAAVAAMVQVAVVQAAMGVGGSSATVRAAANAAVQAAPWTWPLGAAAASPAQQLGALTDAVPLLAGQSSQPQLGVWGNPIVVVPRLCFAAPCC